MLKFIGYLLAAVVAVVAVILLYALTRPDTFHVERTVSINAPADKIYPLIADFNSWPAWSPYEKLDASMTKTLSGAPNGVGAIYEWSGNSKVGAGRMEITEADPASKIVIKLDFKEPMEANNIGTFTLVPKGEATEVTWAIDGPNPYLNKVMDIVFDFDKIIGNDFQEGLETLKTVAEK